MILQTKHYVIEQIDQKKIVDECEISADYIICQSDVLDSVYEDKLISRGYRFLDRLLYFEIETSIVKSSDDNVIQDVVFLCDREYDDVLFDIANTLLMWGGYRPYGFCQFFYFQTLLLK